MIETPGRFSELQLRPVYQAHEDRLRDFYIPVLERTVRYDRLVGYWRSSSLAVAASGVAHFIRNALAHGGTMRVIAGARLIAADVEAILAGEPLADSVARRLLAEPDNVSDLVTSERLRLVAWMVREGLLEVKVGVPCDEQGQPLTSADTDRLFHTKFGVFTDAHGDRIAFQGSVNESAQGWVFNHEAFMIAESWRPEIWERYGHPWEEMFEQHWSEPQPVAGWRIIDLPDAVRDQLIDRLPEDWTPPDFDPEERLATAGERLRQVKDAPLRESGVGLSTLPIEPWPHQFQIASRIVDTWPRSYLLADEVGLGKTIEAGMVIRELLLSGKAKRILILVPASVQRQWQEELWEKCCLDVVSYQRGKFFNYALKEVFASPEASPWAAFPVLLASSHLARTRAHRGPVLAAGPWDLIFVDEAHHARRRGIGGAEGANQLLQLLREMRDAQMYRALLLATATPMQMNTHDIYDLLDLFGLPGRWGSGEGSFDFYYSQLAEPDPKAREWRGMKQMLGDFFAQPEVAPNRVLLKQLQDLSGPARMRIADFHRMSLTGPEIASKDSAERSLLDRWLRAHTPIRDRVFRTTREALREYQRQGLLRADATIPVRHVEDEMIPFGSDQERSLYQRIEEYITRYYEAYNKSKETKPLGFIMTVYRRRLTSSLFAVHRSLQRRLDAIQKQATADAMLDEDDRYALENLTGFEYEELSIQARPYAEEIAELSSFISQLESAIPYDSKAQAVTEKIRGAFLAGHRTVVVFTQFGDTLEWLRDQLRGTYGSQIACYTGKGGSRWNPEVKKWMPLSKEEVKKRFRQGTEVRILIGTDALSEGLNLQTCDRLINYDMPWNFIRVEQRIGRIDRIEGQPEVFVTNYFYRDTIEEQVYSGIREDAAWFDQVVGPAQPVLGRVEQVIQDLAMQTAGAARDQALQDELDAVRLAIKEYQAKPVTLSTLESDVPADPIPPTTSLDLASIERTMVENPLTGPLMHPHPDAHTYLIELDGEKYPMTFDRAIFDKNPEIGFLTYGHPVFERLLAMGSAS